MQILTLRIFICFYLKVEPLIFHRAHKIHLKILYECNVGYSNTCKLQTKHSMAFFSIPSKLFAGVWLIFHIKCIDKLFFCRGPLINNTITIIISIKWFHVLWIFCHSSEYVKMLIELFVNFPFILIEQIITAFRFILCAIINLDFSFIQNYGSISKRFCQRKAIYI